MSMDLKKVMPAEITEVISSVMQDFGSTKGP